MRLLPLLCLGASSLLFLAGCATPSQPIHAGRLPRVARVSVSEAEKLLVISAIYGSGEKFADVTYRVNDLLRDPEIVFWAMPQWLGADPTPGWNKALVIVYEHDGMRKVLTTGEGGEVGVERLIQHGQIETKKGKPATKPKEKELAKRAAPAGVAKAGQPLAWPKP